MDYKQSAAAVFVQQNAALLHTHAQLMNITHSSFMDLNNLEEKDHFEQQHTGTVQQCMPQTDNVININNCHTAKAGC